MKSETLTTIAERLGISVTTVSRVLNGSAEKYRISDVTCEMVRQEAARCNYKSTFRAQFLRKTNTVGLLLPSISNPFFADIAGAIITELDAKGYTTEIFDTRENGKILEDNARLLASRHVDGIIAVPCGNTAFTLEQISASVPTVLVDRYFEDSTLSYVTTNNYQGGLNGTKQVIARGYKDITCIQGVTGSMPNRMRVMGYKDAMMEAGLEEYITVVGSDFSVRNGYLETKLLLQKARKPKAIFSLSGTILLGAIKAIKESGLKIPEDIALLTFDDNIYMDYLTPSIARIAQPLEDMGTLAVKLLLGKISGENTSKSQIQLSPTLISGGSL